MKFQKGDRVRCVSMLDYGVGRVVFAADQGKGMHGHLCVRFKNFKYYRPGEYHVPNASECYLVNGLQLIKRRHNL